MHTQTELLDMARERQGGISDYRLSTMLDCSRAHLSLVRHSRTILSQKQALRLARLAQLPPGYVLGCIEAARADRNGSTGLADAWRAIAAQCVGIGAVMVAALLVAGGAGFSAPAQAVNGSGYESSALVPVYITRTCAAPLESVCYIFAVICALSLFAERKILRGRRGAPHG